MKIFAAIVIILLVAFAIFFYSTRQSSPIPSSDKPVIIASFYPLAEFAQQVGGDLVQVQNITPTGTKPHDYNPSPQDILNLRSADLFIYNGSGLDPWAEKLKADLEKSGFIVKKMTDFVQLLDVEAKDDSREPEGIPLELPSLDGDPHFWLDPIVAQQLVEAIRITITQIDPDNAQQYQSNTTAYLEKLTGLHELFQNGLSTCQLREVVVSHNAFTYLGSRYDIVFLPIAGLSPEAQPSARALGQLAKLAQEKEIKYVLFEPLASPRLAETLASEIGAETLILNPLEGLTQEEKESGKDYLSVMGNNLNNLRLAMGCE